MLVLQDEIVEQLGVVPLQTFSDAGVLALDLLGEL
jgi:hypothetical protein